MFNRYYDMNFNEPLRLKQDSLLIEEIRFWLVIFKEHALLIKLGLPPPKTAQIAKAEHFNALFAELNARATKKVTLNEAFKIEILSVIDDLIAFKKQLLEMTFQIENELYPMVLSHLLKEAFYFKNYLSISPKPDKHSLLTLLKLEVFWLNTLREHLEFQIHLQGESTHFILHKMRQLERLFSQLSQEANDLKYLAELSGSNFNSINRFTEQVAEATDQLRNAQKELGWMACEHELFPSNIEPTFIVHIARETEEFLQKLAQVNSILSEYM